MYRMSSPLRNFPFALTGLALSATVLDAASAGAHRLGPAVTVSIGPMCITSMQFKSIADPYMCLYWLNGSGILGIESIPGS